MLERETESRERERAHKSNQNMQGGTAGTDNDLNRLSAAAGGLARFRSAPPSWVDALLEDDDSLKLSGPHHPPSTTAPSALTHLLTSGTTTTTHYIPDPDPDPGYFQGGGGAQQVTSSAFQRMNSSPAEFLSGNVDGYFSSYGYDFVGATSTGDVDVSPCGKRRRDNHHNSDQPSPSFPCHHGHGRGEQLSATASGLLDLEMDKLLDDSVPCRVRAKRGCATHPRSIAERVRRTRISDRIRKLQELVPNMDKQTNTADMLEEAVEYVKTLQRQIQDLTELQKKCRCMEKS